MLKTLHQMAELLGKVNNNLIKVNDNLVKLVSIQLDQCKQLDHIEKNLERFRRESKLQNQSVIDDLTSVLEEGI